MPESGLIGYKIFAQVLSILPCLYAVNGVHRSCLSVIHSFIRLCIYGFPFQKVVEEMKWVLKELKPMMISKKDKLALETNAAIIEMTY